MHRILIACCYNLTPFFTITFSAGNSNPRYVRSSLYTVPCSKDLLNGCKIPMGLVVQPLADIPQNEVKGRWMLVLVTLAIITI